MGDTYKLQQPTPPPTDATPPPVSTRATPTKAPGRLVSLDAFRGFVMTLLIAGGFGMTTLARMDAEKAAAVHAEIKGTWLESVVNVHTLRHFRHATWDTTIAKWGVPVWDMIQPCFMFMVGIAMPFSYGRRKALGSSTLARASHALNRAALLILLGVFLQTMKFDLTTWLFPNVLCQIGLGYFFAYLLVGRKPVIQVGAIVVILVGYWGLFMMNPPPKDHDFAAVEASEEAGEVYAVDSRFRPWSKNGNFAHFADLDLLNRLRSAPDDKQPGEETGEESTDNPKANTDEAGDNVAAVESDQEDASPKSARDQIRAWWFSDPERYLYNAGGYTTLNFVPSIATTLLGILCGQLLLGDGSRGKKFLMLLLWGAICVGLGIGAHYSVCPIVKRIWTPSWALFSAGYAIWTLAIFYLLFDILPLRLLAFPLVIIGANSIVMYVMGQTLKGWIQREVVVQHFGRVLQTCFGPNATNTEGIGVFVLPTATFVVFWLVGLWMYRNRYFVRL